MSDGKKVASRQIQKQKILSTGHFALIHSGLLTVGNENRHVAIKTLKRTFNSDSFDFILRVRYFHFSFQGRRAINSRSLD